MSLICPNYVARAHPGKTLHPRKQWASSNMHLGAGQVRGGLGPKRTKWSQTWGPEQDHDKRLTEWHCHAGVWDSES